MTQKKSRAAVEAEIRQHVAAEERAYRWVERMALENTVSNEEAIIMFNEILVNHYHDIIEERSISKLCGYPLCSNQLQKTIKQKYHISTKSNRIYETEKIKLFCSSHCYNASKFIEKQIPDTPLWLRNERNRRTVELLTKGMKGKETSIQSEAIPLEMEKLTLEDIDHIREGSETPTESINEETVQDSLDHLDSLDSETLIKNTKNTSDKSVKKSRLLKENIKRPDTKRYDIKEMLEKLKNIISEWFSEETYKIMKKKQDSSPKSANFKTFTKYNNRELTNQDKTTEECEDNSTSGFERKAMQFLSQNPEWSQDSQRKEEKDNTLLKDGNEKRNVFPHIDSKSQLAIRRKIVREKIHVRLNRLAPVLGLLHSDFIEDGLHSLTDTFRFTSQNIVLKPKEWLLATLLLLKFFSPSLPTVKEALLSKNNELETFLLEENIHEMELLTQVVNDLKRTLLFEENEEKEKAVEEDDDCVTDEVVKNDIFSESILNDNVLESENETFDMEEMD